MDQRAGAGQRHPGHGVGIGRFEQGQKGRALERRDRENCWKERGSVIGTGRKLGDKSGEMEGDRFRIIKK